MNKINLSLRLKTIASLINKEDIVWDVGSDHALLPIFLIKNKIIKRAVASEVSRGPYLKSLENVTRYSLNDKIEVVLSFGLDDLKEDISTITICGMGGLLIKEILTKGKDKLDNITTLVLAPNSNQYELRQWLMLNNYLIENEKIVCDANKYYEIIKAVKSPSQMIYEEHQLIFGPVLLKEKNPIFKQKWTKEINKLENILNKINDNSKSSYIKNKTKLDYINKFIN